MNRKTIKVKLGLSEILNASLLGCCRNVQSFKNAKDKYGANTERDGWQNNIMATIGEYAWAKSENIFWNGAIGDYNAADVGGYYQIRASSIVYKHNACLRLHKKDEDEKPYLLALVGMDMVEFVGWLYGCEGKKEEYWCDKWKQNRPAYFIEQEFLHPMRDLV